MAENEGERQWIVEPPAPGEVAFHISFGEGVELTSDQEAALSALMQSLETNDADVTGYQKCRLAECTNKSCSPVRCATFICHHLTTELQAGPGAAWNLMGTFSGLS